MRPTPISPLAAFRLLAPHYRPSKAERPFAGFLSSWFSSLGATVSIDSANNFRADLVPGGSGAESPSFASSPSATPVILQAHLDMVYAIDPACSPAPDPASVGVVPFEENGFLRARGTSLGADDGIGIALAMSLFSDPPPGCPPLRALFTADEESGMSGAAALSPSWLSGARALLNLDWEEACQFCTGSAAAQTLALSAALPAMPASPPPSGFDWFSVTLSGPDYPGGHSGADIHLPIPHPGKDLAACLSLFEDPTPLVVSFRCGHASNAIPTSASAVVGIPRAHVLPFLNAAPPGLVATPVPPPLVCPFPDRGLDFLLLFEVLDQGVIVENSSNRAPVVSSNIGIAEFSLDTGLRIVSHPRAADPGDLAAIRDYQKRLAAELHLTFRASPVFPAWTLPPSSPLLARALDIARDATGRPWTAAPTHAGLECGIFAKKAPSLPILSFGPAILHPHTPAEALDLSTLPPTLDFLRALLPAL